MYKRDLRALTLEELNKLVLSLDEKSFRAKQIFNWLHKNHVNSFEDMKNIPKTLKDKIKNETSMHNIKILDKLSSKDGTIKYLFELCDLNIIESVFMKYSFGNTACISSQVGCKMGCKFCASTKDGLERNLTAGEMLAQIYEIQKDTNQKVNNVVLMGSGEPFDNFDNFKKFIKIINSEDGINLGQRHITVSTCGIVEKIYEFANMKTQVNLAISLHAPNDEIRKITMPIANRYTIEEIVSACKYFYEKTKRRVTYEYALISGVNDSEGNAKELAEKIKGTVCHINLIPVNSIKETSYVKSNKEQIEKFIKVLENNKINATVRRELGSDINAACGQLRRNYKKKMLRK